MVIGININTSRSLKRLQPFALEAKRRNYRVIFFCIYNDVEYSNIKQIGEVRFIRAEEMASCDDVDVLFTQDRCTHPPKAAKVIAVPHSFHVVDYDNSDPWAYAAQMEFLAGCHYLILGNVNIRNFSKYDFRLMLSTIPEHLHLPSREAVIIPGGYPSLDLLLTSVSQENVCPDSVFFAQVDAIESSMCATDVKNIISCLSNYFFKDKIIYSPYPHSRSLQDSKILFEELGIENVFLNTNFESASVFARAFLLVTDSSTTAYTYSFATLRPHIQCQFYGYRKKPTKSEFGWIVYSLEQLEWALKDVLENYGKYEVSLSSLRDKIYLNIGCTANYIFENINTIVKGESLPDWYCVERHMLEALPVSEKDFFDTVFFLPSGYEKIHYYQRALKGYTGEQGSIFEELQRMMTSSRSFTRSNSHNLVCMEISKNGLRYVEYSEYSALSNGENPAKCFISCDADEDINSFNFSSDFLEKCFCGYVTSMGLVGRTGLTVESILDKHEDAYIFIANMLVFNRFAIAFEIFYKIKERGLFFNSRGWDHVFGYISIENDGVRILPSWEVKETLSSGQFGKFAVWGCSGYYKVLRKAGKLPNMEDCICFIDNNAAMHGEVVDGIEVFALESAVLKFELPLKVVLAVSELFVQEIILQVESFFGPNCQN
ncbi:hypothetical protein [Maridesulfovibrio sp. FT414]|uniref:hypothetical protein n=1 Tax=Maridesulfovibrio sp. FT414 TaxID=2979469 RepID=UPI003D80976C